MRVFCDSYEHAHAILPDVIIPYSSYSLLFILRLLGQYFAGRFTIEQLCERYEISQNQFYKWLALWKSHKQEWLGILSDLETSVNTDELVHTARSSSAHFPVFQCTLSAT